MYAHACCVKCTNHKRRCLDHSITIIAQNGTNCVSNNIFPPVFIEHINFINQTMFEIKIMYAIVVMLSLCACLYGHRVARKTGDQAREGACQSFKWGGSSRLHFYACCNNCNGQDKSCDGKTYHSASRGVYCDKCGTDNGDGNGQPFHSFLCGGCTGQDNIQTKCLKGIRRIFNIPGFCWVFSWCFKDKCKAEYPQDIGSQVTSSDDTSYDLQCNNGETVKDSPVDCCQTVNDQCKFVDGQCPPLCCSDPDCCRTSVGRSTSAGTSTESVSGTIIEWMSVFLALKRLL